VDGNVVRVLSRLRALAGDPKAASAVKAHWALARALVETQARPGDLNQGLMELGATVCTPTSPVCGACPLAGDCRALAGQRRDPALPVTRFPAKAKKAAAREERVAVCVLSCAGAVKREGAAASEPRFLLVQRPPDGLLAGLWEFPSVPLQVTLRPAPHRAAQPPRAPAPPPRRPAARPVGPRAARLSASTWTRRVRLVRGKGRDVSG